MNAPRMSLTSETDLLQSVPHMLGFTPRDAIVIVFTRQDRVIYTAHGNLDTPVHLSIAPDVTTDGAIVICYTDDMPALTRQVCWLMLALPRHDLTVVQVHDGRWRRFPDLAWHPLGYSDRVEAAWVLEGSAPLADRAALAESFCYRGTTDPDAVAFTEGMTDLAHRDAVCSRAATFYRAHQHSELDNLVADLQSVATGVPLDTTGRVDLLAVLACVALLAGNGALANLAVTAALAAEPSHALTVLIDQALRRRMSPAALADMLTEQEPAQ